MTQSKPSYKYSKPNIKEVLNHRGRATDIQFELKIIHSTRTSKKWIARGEIQPQTFSSTIFKTYFKKTNDTDSFKSFLYAIDANRNAAPEYLIELHCSLYKAMQEAPIKAKATIHDNLTKDQLKHISYTQVIAACAETKSFPQCYLDHVVMMYSFDENNEMNLQKNEMLQVEDISWNQNTIQKGNKKKLVPYKSGTISLKLFTYDYCKSNGYETSSIISEALNNNNNNNINNKDTFDAEMSDLGLPVMSFREAVSHIHDNNVNETEKKQDDNNNNNNNNSNKEQKKSDEFSEAIAHYESEFDVKYNKQLKPLQNVSKNNKNIQNQNSNIVSNAQIDTNTILLNLVQVLSNQLTNVSNNNAKIDSKLVTNSQSPTNPNNTDNNSNKNSKSDEKEDKNSESIPEFKKGQMARTIAVYDEMILKSKTTLLERCKNKKLVKNSVELDKEKRKLKFFATKDIQIKRSDAKTFSRTWAKKNMPINPKTKKPWTFQDAIHSTEVVGTIGNWPAPKDLVIDDEESEKNVEDQPPNEQ